MTENFTKDKLNRAVLVGLSAHSLTREENATEESMEELKDLLETAGGESVGMVLQQKDSPDPRTFIGQGKVDEVRQLVRTMGADMVIFDNALSPSQQRVLGEELKVGVLVYGALETMALPTSTWEMLGLQNGLEEDDFPQLPPLSVENVDDENCSWALRWMGNQISMLQANFPGKSLVEVAQRLLEQRDPVKYVQTLDFKPDWVSCEYHTAYQQPSMVQKLHDLGIKAAYWTVDGEQAVKDLWPLQPDAIVTNRPDRVREWISELEMTE